MSRENITAFFEKVESDKDLQKKLQRVAEENERETIDRVVKIASSAGFNFTADELAKVRAASVDFFPGLKPSPRADENCCYYAHSCMPGFEPRRYTP